MDDPLAAVDANVGISIFKQCIQEFLKDKVVLLVTHQLQYLSRNNAIVHIVRDGTVTTVESYEDAKSKYPDSLELMTSYDIHSEDV